MKLWSVKFSGFYPVGAVAVVIADSEVQARELFSLFWSSEHRRHDPNPLEIEELSTEPGTVKILLDGNY